MIRAAVTIGSVVAVAGFGACGSPKSGKDKPAPAVEVKAPITEAQLTTVRLTPQAEARLGIATGTVERRMVAFVRSVPGRIEPLPGSSASLLAPVAGTLVEPPGAKLVPGRKVKRGEILLRLRPLVVGEPDVLARGERDVAAARALAEAARSRADRVAALTAQGATSTRAAEEAAAQLRVAEADLVEAEARVNRARQNPFSSDAALPLRAPDDGTVLRLGATPGQIVSSGAALIELARVDQAWIRATLYIGDLDQVDRGKPAAVTVLGHGQRQPRVAIPVDAPVIADSAAASAELVYAIDNADATFLPGQRVLVAVPLTGAADALVAPLASVLYDVHGGAWLYEVTEPHVFVRRRIEIRGVQGDVAVLERGPTPGTTVVTAGAAELFGSEFGAGK
jgi:RND family efflux transporter MFP subunit